MLGVRSEILLPAETVPDLLGKPFWDLERHLWSRCRTYLWKCEAHLVNLLPLIDPESWKPKKPIKGCCLAPQPLTQLAALRQGWSQKGTTTMAWSLGGGQFLLSREELRKAQFPLSTKNQYNVLEEPSEYNLSNETSYNSCMQ